MPYASAKRFGDDQGGATAVEFAIVSPVLLTMILGVFALGSAYYEGATVQRSLERALRTAMVHPELDGSDIEEMLNADLERIGSPEIDFSYTIDDSGEMRMAVARAAYEVPVMIPFIPEIFLAFEAENVMPAPES